MSIYDILVSWIRCIMYSYVHISNARDKYIRSVSVDVSVSGALWLHKMLSQASIGTSRSQTPGVCLVHPGVHSRNIYMQDRGTWQFDTIIAGQTVISFKLLHHKIAAIVGFPGGRGVLKLFLGSEKFKDQEKSNPVFRHSFYDKLLKYTQQSMYACS